MPVKMKSNGVSKDAETKKLRNRVSQQAFRRRQSEYIKQLERKAKDHKPDNERIIELERENQSLRESLIHCHTKLESLRTTICSLGDGITRALDDSGQTSKSTINNEVAEIAAPIEVPSPDSPLPNPDPICDNEVSDIGFESPFDLGLFKHSGQSVKIDNFKTPKTPDFTYSELIHQPEPRILSPLPNIWTHQYQMGPTPYVDALGANEAIAEHLKIDWTPSNSPFSEHVSALKNILREKWDGMGRSPESYPDLFYQSVSTVLSMFNSISRPDAMTWYARTRFYHIVDLTVSLLNPTEQAAKKVHPLYRLTHVQSTNKYPSIVDWIPFPSIRDKLILLHSGNPNVDDIFCDAVSGYVVQTNMSELVEGASVLPVHVRVLDLIKAMDEKSKASDVGKLPASNARAIFDSPATARLVFQKLRMDHGVSQYMMDPAFFPKVPRAV
ncbi:hypothetical protein N7541_011851 [Penicillium brevicompactum]|uniref:Putative transcription factor kapC n=1 Tax=Penicillium brevicompactum TaxID=5074 RepID=A0A9W9UIY1_PENBR|nr:hypothetical protein N7541_011851 [Penicillium brevicompactum]